MVTDSATVTVESLQETTIALSNGAIADTLRPPLPPNIGVPYAPKIRQWNGHISETGDPIHFVFGSRVGFSLFRVGGSNDAISGYIKSMLVAGRQLR